MITVLLIYLHLMPIMVTACCKLIVASFLTILMMMHQFMNQDMGDTSR